MDGEITSFWGNQRKAWDTPEPGLETQIPSLPAMNQQRPPYEDIHFLPGHLWAGDVSALNLLIDLRPYAHSLLFFPYPLPRFLDPDAVSMVVCLSVFTFKKMTRRIWV